MSFRLRASSYLLASCAWLVGCPPAPHEPAEIPGTSEPAGDRPSPEREREPFWEHHGNPEDFDYAYKTWLRVEPTTYCVPEEGRPASLGDVDLAWKRAYRSNHRGTGRQLVGERDGRLYARSLFLDRTFGWPEYGAAGGVEMLGPPGTLVLPSTHFRLISTIDGRTQVFLRYGRDLSSPSTDKGAALVTPDDTVVTTLHDGRVIEVDLEGRIVWSAQGRAGPTGIARDPELGGYYVATFQWSRDPTDILLRIDGDGQIVWERPFHSLRTGGIFMTEGGELAVLGTTREMETEAIFGIDRLTGEVTWAWPRDGSHPELYIDPFSARPVPHPAGGFLSLASEGSFGDRRDRLFWVDEDLSTRWVVDIDEMAREQGWAAEGDEQWSIFHYQGAPDGSVYARGTGESSRNGCRVYAFEPDGSMRWWTHTKHPVREILPGENGRLYVYMYVDPEHTFCADEWGSWCTIDEYRLFAAYDSTAPEEGGQEP